MAFSIQMLPTHRKGVAKIIELLIKQLFIFLSQQLEMTETLKKYKKKMKKIQPKKKKKKGKKMLLFSFSYPLIRCFPVLAPNPQTPNLASKMLIW